MSARRFADWLQTISYYRITEKLGGWWQWACAQSRELTLAAPSPHFLLNELCEDPAALECFLSRSASCLGVESSWNICTIYDIGEANGADLPRDGNVSMG